MKAHKDILRKEQEEDVLLNGLERLIMKISGQNIDNMNKYTEIMTTLVSSLKERIVKKNTSTPNNTSSPYVSAWAQSRVTKLTKPVKVLI